MSRAIRFMSIVLAAWCTAGMAADNALLREYGRLAETDPAAAAAFARKAAANAASLRANDPRRADALEILVRSQIDAGQFAEALQPVNEAVRIRRNQRPVDYELLGMALGLQGTVLFALDRAADADRVFREQIDTFRRAYPANDLRLAQRLEAYAQYVQKGFGRPRYVIELLQEAIAIRNAHPGVSPGRLAESLQELGIQQIALSDFTDADANLAKAAALLQAEVTRNPAHEEAKAGLAQVLVLRAGLAGRMARRDQALEFAAAARRLEFKDRLLRAETELLIATALAAVLEMFDDLPGAIAEQQKVLATFERNADLVKSGQLDPGGIGDAQTWLAALYLETNDLDRADAAIAAARARLGDTSDLLFRAAELARKRGLEKESLALYQQALRARKDKASEVTVLFGTNRKQERGAEVGRFGVDVDDKLSFGEAVVLVPGGQFSTEATLKTSTPPSIPVGLATDPERLAIRSKTLLDAAGLRTAARKSLAGARLYHDTAIVFVHGFNVKFDAALQRGAQLVRDLNFDGPLFVFSWPSKGDWKRYGTDRVTAGNASDALVAFLTEVATATGIAKIHVIAHSMGNRVLLPALVKVAANPDGPLRGRLGEVILAAPAVPERDFATWVDGAVREGAPRFTLYASAVDKAMLAGYVVEWGTVLAGHATNGEPLLHPKVESIDISEAGTFGLFDLNHDVFASNPVMSEDMRQLLQTGQRPPGKRISALGERKGRQSGAVYWHYRRP